MCQTFATLNSTLTILARYGYRMTWFIIFLFVFLSPLTSLIDFFSLLTICLSLLVGVLSSSDQIPNSSLNLKCLSLSLHLKSNPKNGVGCVACQSRSHTNGNSNSQFKTKPRNGIITNQKDLHPVKLAGRGGVTKHHKWDGVVLASISPLSNFAWSRLPLSCRLGRLGLFNLALHHLVHCRIFLLSLAVVVAMFFKVVVVGCVWWFCVFGWL